MKSVYAGLLIIFLSIISFESKSQNITYSEISSSIVYPNPFVHETTLTFPHDFRYIVYDITGNVVESGHSAGKVHICASLRPGIYILKILYGSYIAAFKIEKTKQ